MINRRSQHRSVCMRNKLFVIGGKYNATCEVFDSSSMKFVSIKQLKVSNFNYVSAVSVGDKILVFCSGEGIQVLTYHVDNNEWYSQSKRRFNFKGLVCLSKLAVN